MVDIAGTRAWATYCRFGVFGVWEICLSSRALDSQYQLRQRMGFSQSSRRDLLQDSKVKDQPKCEIFPTKYCSTSFSTTYLPQTEEDAEVAREGSTRVRRRLISEDFKGVYQNVLSN